MYNILAIGWANLAAIFQFPRAQFGVVFKQTLGSSPSLLDTSSFLSNPTLCLLLSLSLVSESRNNTKTQNTHTEPAMDSDEGKLFIGGLAWDTTEDKLTDYFNQYGDVTQTVIMRDKTTGRPRGFGFVVFSDPAVLDRVLNDKHTIDGRVVSLCPSSILAALAHRLELLNAFLVYANFIGFNCFFSFL